MSSLSPGWPLTTAIPASSLKASQVFEKKRPIIRLTRMCADMGAEVCKKSVRIDCLLNADVVIYLDRESLPDPVTGEYISPL